MSSPGCDASINRSPHAGEQGQREDIGARFLLLPWRARSAKMTFATMNARTETITTVAA